MKNALLFIMTFLTLALYGCGSGDSSSSSGTVINGMASKGPITGGNVAIFAVTSSGHRGALLATTTTSNGTFSANIGSYTGAIFATMSGSSATYTDETTGSSTGLGTQKHLRAVALVKGGQMNLAITPLTEVAYQRASSSALTFANISSSNNLIGRTYLKGLPSGTSIVSTLPANVLSTTTTDAAQIGYGLVLANVSSYIKSYAATLSQAITDLTSINASTNSSTNSNVQTVFTALPTSSYLQSGIASTPMAITLTPSVAGVIANGTSTITFTAPVKGLYGTALSNTSVTFTVTSGTATFANGTATQTVTVDSSGNPSTTVALKSSTVQSSVTVTATAGTVSTSTNVAFGQDPTTPTAVALSASPATLVADNSTTSTVTATVTNYLNAGIAGQTVTFTIAHGSGTLTSGSSSSSSSVTATTNSSGVATVTLASGTAGSVTLSASTSTPALTSNPQTVTFTANPAAPAKVAITETPSSGAPADGSSTITFTAKVTNSSGATLSGVPLTISHTGVGTLSSTTGNSGSDANPFTFTMTSTTAGAANITVTTTATEAYGSVSGTGSGTFTSYTRPTTATIVLSTEGSFNTGSSAIGSLDAVLTFPSNLSFDPNNDAVVSGAAATVTPNPSLAANVQTAGNVSIAMSAGLKGTTVVGFPIGGLATFTFTIPSTGAVPNTSTSFSVSLTDIYDNSSSPVAQKNITLQISSVTIQ